MRILLVEDDREAASYLVKGLTESGHSVEHAADGDKGLQLATDNAYDALIVDRMLPKRDGLSLIEEIRRAGNNTPVLILSALDAVDERVTGLKAGGDDYLTKPFSIEELLARLRALLRRPPQAATSETAPIQIGDLMIDAQQRRCWYPDASVDLTKIEFDLLLALAVNKEIVIERSRLYELVWGYDVATETRTLDATISYLRGKLERPDRPRLIHTLRGIGYVIREPR